MYNDANSITAVGDILADQSKERKGEGEAVNYNLLDERWIPVLRKNGNPDRVGIVDALSQAGQIRQIAASNPMDRVAILRFLLALLYWCRGNPPDDKDSISSFPLDWFKKLEDNKDCFNLLGDGKRFYQCETNSGKIKKKSANYLIQEVPTGTNSWHFRHSTDMKDGLCRACCATGLLRLPLFATGGGSGKSPAINQKPPIYAIPIGDSLLRTLCLSWREVAGSDLGTPAWEKPGLKLPDEGEIPLLVGLTWVPRRVWLENPEEPEAVCVSCGRTDVLIRKSVFAGMGSTQPVTRTNLTILPPKVEFPKKFDKRLKYDKAGKCLVLRGNLSAKEKDDLLKLSSDALYQQAVDELYSGQSYREWKDPHVMRAVAPPNALKATDASAKQWAKVLAGNVADDERAKRTSIITFATVQNDKYLEATENLIPSLSESQRESFSQWAKDKLDGELRRIVRGLRKRRKDDARVATSAVASIRPGVEANVSQGALNLASGDPGAWEEAARAYRPMMAAVAKSLSPGHTTAALWTRRRIRSVVPDLRPKSEARRKDTDK